jgi:hypothetical protein
LFCIFIEGETINSTIKALKPYNRSDPLIHGLGSTITLVTFMNLMQDFSNIHEKNDAILDLSIGDYFFM